MRLKHLDIIVIPAALASVIVACGASSVTSTVASGPMPAGYDQFVASVTARVEGANVVVQTGDLPNHSSPYWGAGNTNYEAPQAGMSVNPNRISAQTYVFRIPRVPVAATSPADTPMDAIGIALNGVVFFNQYAAMRAPLTGELATFDRFNGHPAPRNNYHYHIEPAFLTVASNAKLLGFILDGYPIYGTRETDGSTPAGLDACNGHRHATAEYPGGTYHYHVVAAPPYLVGCFHGVAGTVTN